MGCRGHPGNCILTHFNMFVIEPWNCSIKHTRNLIKWLWDLVSLQGQAFIETVVVFNESVFIYRAMKYDLLSA